MRPKNGIVGSNTQRTDVFNRLAASKPNKGSNNQSAYGSKNFAYGKHNQSNSMGGLDFKKQSSIVASNNMPLNGSFTQKNNGLARIGSSRERNVRNMRMGNYMSGS